VKGSRRAGPFFERALRGCRDGTLGFWSSAALMAEVQKRANDGTLTDTDLTELERRLADLAGVR